MRSEFHPRWTWASLALMLACAGCGAEVAETNKPTPAVPAKPANDEASVGDGEASAPAGSKPAGTSPRQPRRRTAKYRPPFPHRRNLFEPIRKSPAMAHDGRDSGESVVLKGFADVGEPKVVLAIDGVTTPLATGGERYGVRVISISPPQAVLQRGRNRWTATLQ